MHDHTMPTGMLDGTSLCGVVRCVTSRMEAADFFWCRHASDIELSPELQVDPCTLTPRPGAAALPGLPPALH